MLTFIKIIDTIYYHTAKCYRTRVAVDADGISSTITFTFSHQKSEEELLEIVNNHINTLNASLSE